MVEASHTCIRQGRSVSVPKASRLKKLPQRPTAWPMKRPMTPTSISAPTESFLTLQKMTSTVTAAMMPP